MELSSHYYMFINKVKNINNNKIFLSFLIIKIFLIIFLLPNITSNLFLPFIQNTIDDFSFDPWSNFLINGGDVNSFPYGLIMLIAYLPLSIIGNLIDKNIYDFNFFEIGFKLTSLIFDYILLIFLSFLSNHNSKKLLILCYWLSPISIYTSFIHGQLDIVPITLLIGSLYFLKSNRYKLSGVFFAFSFSSKFSMLISLPFILVYIYKRRGFQSEFYNYLSSLLITSAILSIPFLLFSNGFLEMVLETREVNRLYSVFINYGANLKLFIVPFIYIFSLYLFWRLKRITQDLLLISIGIGFLSILSFISPAPGWTLWIIPFLTFYQINSRKDIFLITLIYSLFHILNSNEIYRISNLENLSFFNYFNYLDNLYLRNMFFTLQQSLGLLIAVRMYIYGIKRNNFYSISNKAILISIEGNEIEKIFNFQNGLNNLFFRKDINIKYLSSIINKNLIEKSDDQKLIENSKFNQEKVTYYANYMYDNIFKVEKEFYDSNKLYQVFINDLNLDMNLLMQRTNIRIKLEKDNKQLEKIAYSEIKNKLLIFSFKNLNEKDNINNRNFSVTTYFPLGFLHKKLFNLLISISSLNVDIELINNQKIVKMEIEGSPSKEDISLIAKCLITDIDDFSLNHKGWLSGYLGIIQIILVANIYSILKNKSF